ncbi:hypothetical protein DI272_36595 [Streptomyces sp. Act143]|uniref:hypothetical protein n=1 Tax=Streptomyces sp. Act143 TaxID=2200760 RepID=UPI000D67FD39|nr:hypothetical protein [Streptomyces sp. Act143]PWI19062.1 hypothetical protein DI272_36595 [Streptomyces sp. Act143]
MIAAVAVACAAAVLGVSMCGGGPVNRPTRPGAELAEHLDALRGANDLVRATRADVGRDPALYPTAYGRLEAEVRAGERTGKPMPEVRSGALTKLARTDILDTPAWRAYYVCLSLAGSTTGDAVTILERAGLRKDAEKEALAYLRSPDPEDDALTSLATRAAFLDTLSCTGHDGDAPRAAVDRLAADTARVGQPVPVLYAVEALRTVGVHVRPARALRDADGLLKAECTALDPIQRAALALLRQQSTPQTRKCLKPALHNPDPQTRWLARRALTIGVSNDASSLPAPKGHIRTDGLVAKSPAQLGTLTATYNAARALTAGAQQGRVPDWLTQQLKQLGSGRALEPSDRLLLAMTCHRLSLACGPQAEKGAKEIARLPVPRRLTRENQRRWYAATVARAEFGLPCRHASIELPRGDESVLSARSLRIVVALADAGCATEAERLTEKADLVAQARRSLGDGDLLSASDAVQAALASDQSIPQTFWDDLPGLMEPYRDTKYPDLYADSPGGTASADATRAAYYLLA